jgi:hypothetical protein
LLGVAALDCRGGQKLGHSGQAFVRSPQSFEYVLLNRKEGELPPRGTDNDLSAHTCAIFACSEERDQPILEFSNDSRNNVAVSDTGTRVAATDLDARQFP